MRFYLLGRFSDFRSPRHYILRRFIGPLPSCFSFRGLGADYGLGRGLNLNIYSSNSRGRSAGQVTLETTPSKVAELQIGNV